MSEKLKKTEKNCCQDTATPCPSEGGLPPPELPPPVLLVAPLFSKDARFQLQHRVYF